MAAITIPTTIFLSNKLKSVARIVGLGEVIKIAGPRDGEPIRFNRLECGNEPEPGFDSFRSRLSRQQQACSTVRMIGQLREKGVLEN
jgi:hypothetical protein